MKKFVCAALIAAVGICSAFAFTGCTPGEAFVEYELSEDGDYYIVSGVSGDKRGLVSYDIPATYAEEEGGELLPVKEVGEGAFMLCTALTKITLPDSITVIARNAFSYCTFKEFTIPDGVTEIGYGAFGACNYLTEITVPASVTKIEPLAFAYCTALEKAVVKAEITVLDSKVFYNSAISHGGSVYTNTALKEVYLPASLKKIYKDAFSGNIISDIYFGGSTEQWNELYFYELVQKEDEEDKYIESKVEKSEIIPSGTEVHCGVQF